MKRSPSHRAARLRRTRPRPGVYALACACACVLAPAIAAAQQEGEAWPALTLHQPPRPLAQDAATENWPRFLGPRDNASTRETRLQLAWPEAGPPRVWEAEKGSGYTSPALAEGKLVLFHRVEDREVVDCLHPETGRRLWTFAYPVDYEDRYGYNNGPRASPVIDGDRVYVVGVTARVHCLRLDSGEVVWSRDLGADYQVPQGFFGHGPTPLVWNHLLIHNVGGRAEDGGVSVAAFDKLTGEPVWTARDSWGFSYASPVAASLRGRERILVLAGCESRPPEGGLLCLDPADGRVEFRFPWRSDKYESVNASTPVVLDDRRIFLSECYSRGGVLLEIDDELKARPAWTAPDFGMHWMTPVHRDGFLYGFPGRNEPDAALAGYDAATGKEAWRENLEWNFELADPRGRKRTFRWGMFRGSLLQTPDACLALGELGTLAVLDLTPRRVEVRQRADLFRARETWSLPALHRGLLYVAQHTRDMLDDKGPRLICYDLRGE